MAKKTKIQETVEITTKKVEETISFERALKLYKSTNPMANLLMKDKEVMVCYMKKFIPTLVATKEEFFSLLNKF